MNRLLLLLSALLVSALASGCGSERRGRGVIVTGCSNGDTRACTCPNGAQSVQICMDDRYGVCQCSTETDAGDDPTDTGGGGEDGDTPPPPDDSGVHDAGTMDAEEGPPDLGMRDTGGPNTPDVGVPVGQRCDVYADNCGPNAVCTQEDQLVDTTCQPAGNAFLDQPCDRIANNCRSGQGTCVDLGFGFRCYRGCSEAVTCPDSGDICWLQNEVWGVCDVFTQCDPLAPNCPAGRSCSIVAGDGTCGCTAAGTGQLNGPCSAENNCAPGQGICLNVGQGALCYQACDPSGSTSCIQGQCATLQGISWGICYSP